MDETTKAAMESGRPLTIFNIREVHQLNPNATHVTNHYYGDQFVPKEVQRNEPSALAPENATRNPQLSKKSILEYVMRLHPLHVREEWREKYQALWEEILELPAVSATIYNKGKQQGTTFNRNLVANILHLMAEKKVLTFTASAKNMAIVLEGDADASVRAQLGVMPPKEMEYAIMELVK
jgi:hypothetical protein